jgi:hypothetical protein
VSGHRRRNRAALLAHRARAAEDGGSGVMRGAVNQGVSDEHDP